MHLCRHLLQSSTTTQQQPRRRQRPPQGSPAPCNRSGQGRQVGPAQLALTLSQHIEALHPVPPEARHHLVQRILQRPGPCRWAVASKIAQAQSLQLQHDVLPWWPRGERSTSPRIRCCLAKHVWPACRCWREASRTHGRSGRERPSQIRRQRLWRHLCQICKTRFEKSCQWNHRQAYVGSRINHRCEYGTKLVIISVLKLN